jgi:hypothetical protein
MQSMPKDMSWKAFALCFGCAKLLQSVVQNFNRLQVLYRPFAANGVSAEAGRDAYV